MNKIYASIAKGLRQAKAYSKGRKVEVRVFRPKPVDVKELRNKIGMTQSAFAASLGISLGTLRHWERGDRYPHGPALVLLNILYRDPQTVLRVLQKG